MLEKFNLHTDLVYSVFNHIPLGIIILEENDIISAINSQAEELLGVSSASLINRNLKVICPELVVNGKITNSQVTLINNKSISVQSIELFNDSITYNKILFMEDTSKKHEYHILENIVNSIDEAIMACDRDGKLIIYNDANQKLDNLLREQVLGQPITKIYNVTQHTSLLFQAMVKRKPILNKHQNYITYTGNNIDIVCSTYPLFKDSEMVGAVSIMRDYSKIKELTDKVIELQEKLFQKRENNIQNGSIESAKYVFNDILGSSKSLSKTINQAKMAANSDSPVLIYGETGTGKELFAQSIHNASKRSNGPFIAFNCAAIPENLLEGILFGTVQGSFTGAVDRPGLFEQANNGTLLLDELNSMGVGLQSKLLRVLQEGTLRRVGAIKEIPINVRIISIINIEPSLAIQSHKLRQDLFYRLSVVYLKVPPLRNRREDIPLLVKSFIEKYNRALSKNVHNLSTQVMNMFMEYPWPGNVRELQHSIESAMNIMDYNESIIQPTHLPEHILPQVETPKDTFNLCFDINSEPLANTLETVEHRVISLALQRNNWNISYTARQLGIKRQSLQYRIKKYGIKQNKQHNN